MNKRATSNGIGTVATIILALLLIITVGSLIAGPLRETSKKITGCDDRAGECRLSCISPGNPPGCCPNGFDYGELDCESNKVCCQSSEYGSGLIWDGPSEGPGETPAGEEGEEIPYQERFFIEVKGESVMLLSGEEIGVCDVTCQIKYTNNELGGDFVHLRNCDAVRLFSYEGDGDVEFGACPSGELTLVEAQEMLETFGATHEVYDLEGVGTGIAKEDEIDFLSGGGAYDEYSGAFRFDKNTKLCMLGVEGTFSPPTGSNFVAYSGDEICFVLRFANWDGTTDCPESRGCDYFTNTNDPIACIDVAKRNMNAVDPGYQCFEEIANCVATGYSITGDDTNYKLECKDCNDLSIDRCNEYSTMWSCERDPCFARIPDSHCFWNTNQWNTTKLNSYASVSPYGFIKAYTTPIIKAGDAEEDPDSHDDDCRGCLNVETCSEYRNPWTCNKDPCYVGGRNGCEWVFDIYTGMEVCYTPDAS